MFKKDGSNVRTLLQASYKIQNFALHLSGPDELFADERTFDAILMNIIIMGEAVTDLSDNFKQMHSHLAWQAIRDFRNQVAHEYFSIDAEEVWQYLTNFLPQFTEHLQKIAKFK